MSRFLLAAALLALCGCASQHDHDILRQRVLQLENRVKDLDGLRPGQANMGAELDSLKSRANALDGKVDELSRKLDSLQRTVSPPPPPPPTETGEGGEPRREVVEDPAEALYNEAYNLFRQGNYQGAANTWGEFVRAYKAHQLVPNAIYQQGEAYMAMKDYNRAVLAYEEIITKHAKSPKAPGAYYKQGQAFLLSGKKDAAKLRFNETIQKFPNTPEAAQAKDGLAKAR